MPQIGAITGHIDVAQAALYTFWLFFAGLICYLHRENKREGYPLIAPDRVGNGRVVVEGLPPVPPKKSFLMQDGSVVMVPRDEMREPITRAVAVSRAQGSPLMPTGEPLTSGIGPAAYAQRADHADLSFDDGLPKIVPLRVAPAFFLAWEDPDIRGFAVLGRDGTVAGEVIEAWIDRSEVVIRYVEVQLALRASADRVLLPMNYLTIDAKRRTIRCGFITSAQFALAPRLKNPDQVTLLEEDKIVAFYSAGQLYNEFRA